jgi:uncharacterized repeat protein (TIGR01451 family)
MGGFKRATAAAFALLAAQWSSAPAHASSGSADLSATVSGPGTAFVGDTVSYGVALFNGGPDEATGVLFTAKLTGPGQYTTAIPGPTAGCNSDGRSISCKLGKIPARVGVVFDIGVATTATGTVVQSFAVTARQDDGNTSNNSGTVTTSVQQRQTDLAASITGPATAIAEDTVVFTASVSNLGPLAASGVLLTDAFSGPATFSAAGSDPRCSASGQTVTCGLGSVAAGATVQVAIAFALTAPGTVSQTVQVSADSPPDPNPSNDSASTTTTIQPHAADLILTLSSSPEDPAFTFEPLVWQLEVDNHGPLAASSVVVTGTLSGPASWDASQSSPACSVSGATITCSVGALSELGAASLSLAAHASPGTVGASFSTSSELPDQDLSDNTVTAPALTVLPSADLRVAVCCVTLTPGVATIHLVATDNGPDDDPGVILSDVWSPSATLAGFSSSQGSCTVFMNSLTCSLGTLPSGGTATVDVSLQAPSGTVIDDGVTISGSVFDFSGNDSDSVTVTVP